MDTTGKKRGTAGRAAPTSRDRARVSALLADAGRTYAQQAGIRLADKPAPLWQLLVLANLISARIQASIAVTGAASLFAAGGRTPRGMAELTWDQRTSALVKGRYHHYADGTATRLGECADIVRDRYAGDLRKLAREADEQPARVRTLLQQFPGIGPAGAWAFCRDAQSVWPFLRPAMDQRVLSGAERVHLPTRTETLARTVPPERLDALADALVRVGLDRHMADRVLADDENR